MRHSMGEVVLWREWAKIKLSSNTGEAVRWSAEVAPIRSERLQCVVAARIGLPTHSFSDLCRVVRRIRLGLRQPSPVEKAAENITAVPTPRAPVER